MNSGERTVALNLECLGFENAEMKEKDHETY